MNDQFYISQLKSHRTKNVLAKMAILILLTSLSPAIPAQAPVTKFINSPQSPSLVVVPNGMAVVTSDGSDGSTVKVVNVQQLGTLWANAANRAPNFSNTDTQMGFINNWTPAQFSNSGGPQIIRTLAISGDGTKIYAGGSGYLGTNKTPAIYRIGPGSTTPQLLHTLPSYVANNTIRRGIGGLDIDDVHNALFASDLADGIIYRRDANTANLQLGSFDPLVAYNIGVTNLPPYGERVIAVAYHKLENRLYYSMWGYDAATATGVNSIRSIGLTAAGAFDPPTDRLEFNLPGSISPVADIEFNAAGNRMLMAEESLVEVAGAIVRGSQTARGLEYTGGTGTWIPDPTIYDTGTLKYNIGVTNGTNSRGGAAWGYTSLNLSTGTFTGNENFVVFTGDALRADTSFVSGLQWMPSTGGGAGGIVASNSLIGDLDHETTTPDDIVYGDVDICRSLAPTASLVSISGQVRRGDGTAIPKVTISLADAGGTTQTAMTNTFGYYRFDGVVAGETYILTAVSKGHVFETRIVTVNDGVSDLDFTAIE